MAKADTQPTLLPRLVRRPALLRLGLTSGAIAGLIARRELTPLRIGKGLYFDYGEVRRLLDAARRQRPSAPPPPLRAA